MGMREFGIHGIAIALIGAVVLGCGSGAAASNGNAAKSVPAGASPVATVSTGLAIPTAALETPGSSVAQAYPDLPNACAAVDVLGDPVVLFEAAGQVRQALVHLPAKLPAGRIPAVIGLHGYSSTSGSFASYTHLSEKADSSGFIAVYPQALSNPTEWQIPGVDHQQSEIETSDHVFLDQIVSWLAASPCVDAGRIFLVGHSNGGGMTYQVSCELSGKLAGIGLVSAEYFHDPCTPAKPAPLIVFHGLDDPILPFAGGHVNGAPGAPMQLPADAVMANWATIYGCKGDPRRTKIHDGVQLDWQGCAAPLRFNRLDSGGHGWSTAETTDRLWEFFAGLPSA